MIVDVHAHYMDPRYAAVLAAHGITGFLTDRRPGGSNGYEPPKATGALPLPSFTPFGEAQLPERFAAMDAAGVSRQILSPTQAPYIEARDQGIAAARLVNDIHHEAAVRHPDRFAFFASLPLPHVEESLDELKRGFDDLGAVGAAMHTFCLNETIAQDAYEPIWRELDRRQAPLFLHPCQNGLCSHLVNDFGLTVCAGASFEDTVAVLHLIGKQIPVRYPGIKFIVPHFGGPLAMLANRLDGQMPRQEFLEPPSQTLRRLYYDIVGWGSRGALLAAIETYGESQIVPGSDWPFLLHHESYTQTFDNIRQAGLPEATVHRILHENAQKLLGW